MDMLGNLAEWTSDYYNKDYYFDSPTTDPQGPAEGTTHAPRGSSMEAAPRGNGPMSSQRRPGFEPDHYSRGIGFRCAKNL